MSHACKKFLVILGFLLGGIIEGYSSSSQFQFTGFIAEEGIDAAFKRGKYPYVSAFLRKHRDAYAEEREGLVQARGLLYLVGDNGPLFPENLRREGQLTRSFLEFLPEAERKGFPTDFLRAFWHLKKPLGPMVTGPMFPDDYDNFFSRDGHITRDPAEGALIFLRKAARKNKHAKYWLGHLFLSNSLNLWPLLSRLQPSEQSKIFELIVQWAGRGAISGLALANHRQAVEEERKFHYEVNRETQPDWKEGCGWWGCFWPGRKVCQKSPGGPCDLRYFDPGAWCSIRSGQGEAWECNCCCMGCSTTWTSKEAWARGKDCGGKSLYLCSKGSRYCGTCLNVTGVSISLIGLGIETPIVVLAGVIIAGVGTGGQLLGDALPDTENERREESRWQQFTNYMQGIREEIAPREPPLGEASALPTAHPSHEPSLQGLTPVIPTMMRERDRHHSAPERESGAGIRGWIRNSLKSARRQFENLSLVERETPSLISAAERDAMRAPPPPPVVVQQPQPLRDLPSRPQNVAIAKPLSARSSVRHAPPPPAGAVSVAPSHKPPFARQEDDS